MFSKKLTLTLWLLAIFSVSQFHCFAAFSIFIDWVIFFVKCLFIQGVGDFTTTTTEAPTTTPGCGLPVYANDEYCDDENNNAECNWDGGACCSNTSSGWDAYCSACQCLDPNAGTIAPVTCEDEWPEKKCLKKKKKGKCNKVWVAGSCKKTCGKCWIQGFYQQETYKWLILLNYLSNICLFI